MPCSALGTVPSSTPFGTSSGLIKRFGTGSAEVMALDSVDLSIEAGEAVALMGPSGSGKSTLLHLIGAIDTPSARSIRVDGIEVVALRGAEAARYRRSVGFVFQGFPPPGGPPSARQRACAADPAPPGRRARGGRDVPTRPCRACGPATSAPLSDVRTSLAITGTVLSPPRPAPQAPSGDAPHSLFPCPPRGARAAATCGLLRRSVCGPSLVNTLCHANSMTDQLRRLADHLGVPDRSKH